MFLNNAPNNFVIGNTIQGNIQYGIYLNGTGATGNQITGNTIDGTRPDSSTLPPYNINAYQDDTTRQNQGIVLNGANGNLIETNVIEHNIIGIEVVNLNAPVSNVATDYNRVYANTIDQNLIGIRTTNATSTAVVGNTIDQNAGIGVSLKGTLSANNIIQGNTINQNVGLDPQSTLNRPPNQVIFGNYNLGTGVYIEGQNNLVGPNPGSGPLAGTPDFLADFAAAVPNVSPPTSAGNAFLGDLLAGVYIFGGANNPVLGNTFGPAPDPYVSGQTVLPNYGILLFNAPGNTADVILSGPNANRFAPNGFAITSFRSFNGTPSGTLFSVSSSVNQSIPLASTGATAFVRRLALPTAPRAARAGATVSPKALTATPKARTATASRNTHTTAAVPRGARHLLQRRGRF